MGTLSNVKITAESSLYRHDGQDLVDKVRAKVQDDSYGVDAILALFNACLVEIAGEVLLEQLEAWETIETDPNASTVPLPADYHRRLRFCQSLTTNRQVHVYGGRAQLDRHFVQRDQNGRVLGVAPLGRSLYYQRIPQSAEHLQLNYFRYPEPLRSRDDKPDCLPPHLIEPLLVNYAAKELFSEIEDGIEGPQVNTERYTAKYDKARAALIRFVGPEQRAPVEIVDEMYWDDLAYGTGAW
jgi:hypothetical protein